MYKSKANVDGVGEIERQENPEMASHLLLHSHSLVAAIHRQKKPQKIYLRQICIKPRDVFAEKVALRDCSPFGVVEVVGE